MSDELATLSAREREVFVRLARGETVGFISAALGLSVNTVSTYRTRIVTKTGLTTDVDMAHYAIARGLVACKYMRFPMLDEALSQGDAP